MSKFKDVQLTRQSVTTRHDIREVVYMIQGCSGTNVHSYRTENPARALTVCKPYVRDHRTVQITAWIRVGVDCMIPMTYAACSERDLTKVFSAITKDVACALQSTQLDEEREEQREEASHEIPSFSSFPEFMCESGEALER